MFHNQTYRKNYAALLANYLTSLLGCSWLGLRAPLKRNSGERSRNNGAKGGWDWSLGLIKPHLPSSAAAVDGDSAFQGIVNGDVYSRKEAGSIHPCRAIDTSSKTRGSGRCVCSEDGINSINVESRPGQSTTDLRAISVTVWLDLYLCICHAAC